MATKIQGSLTYLNMFYMLLMWEIRIDCWMMEELSATRNTEMGKMKSNYVFLLKGYNCISNDKEGMYLINFVRDIKLNKTGFFVCFCIPVYNHKHSKYLIINAEYKIF